MGLDPCKPNKMIFSISFDFMFHRETDTTEASPTQTELQKYMESNSRYEDYVENLFEDTIGTVKYSKGVVRFKIDSEDFHNKEDILKFLNNQNQMVSGEPGDECVYPTRENKVLGFIKMNNIFVN